MEPEPTQETQWSDIERRMNTTTQQYLIGQVNANRAMIDLHEKEMVLLWGALLAIVVLVVVDNTHMRKQVSRLIASETRQELSSAQA
jgi:hypothetical protein